MKTVKRVEIVVDQLALPELLRALDGAGASGWTVLRDASGRGGRGLRRGDDLTDVLTNAVVLCAGEPAAAERLVAAVRPLLATYGGMCLVSDAAWVLHGAGGPAGEP
jgi:nitrogen regulatory protein PII